jgi:phenylalanyl-tRNA synthetase beta chain
MNTSVHWLNRYLDPADLTPDEAVEVLEAYSFPIESREDRPGGDAVLDVEITSNRGDCLCHLGLAREIAAATGRKLAAPAPPALPAGDDVAARTGVENRVPDLCPRFTARLVTGVKVGPSPAWLAGALESVGLRPINNVVDVSNFVLHELGHPNHVFDLDTLDERRLVVRHAERGERLVTLEDREVELRPEDLVVADARRAVSLAGVIGGRDTGVTEKTTSVLLEVATWDPVTIRRTARRLDIRTDAGYRFERTVDAREIPAAADRCVELILEVAGGEVVPGTIDVGAPLDEPRTVRLRLDRVEHVLGKPIEAPEIATKLGVIGFGVTPGRDGALECVVPNARPDITREIDVIEEVARLHGMDHFEVQASLPVPLQIEHPARWERRERATAIVRDTLAASGYYETVTFSFLTADDAARFMEPGYRPLKIDEDRRRDTPFLRPSLIPSLLHCRKANQDARVAVPGGVRLFEIASRFDEVDDGATHARRTRERPTITLLADAGAKPETRQERLRRVRGAIEAVAHALGGEATAVELTPVDAHAGSALEGATHAAASIAGEPVGLVSVMGPEPLKAWDLDEPVIVAELDLDALVALYPGSTGRIGLPAFPAIDRDLSLVVEEATPWASLRSLVDELALEQLESLAFVAAFRGKQVGAGRKSVTLRLTFRSPDRTLRHEEVDPQVERLVGAARERLGAEVRV